MRIAQVAPLFESVPPKFYGGTERVVSYLTEELVNQGHDVTLFASGDSNTNARLLSPIKNCIILNKSYIDSISAHILMLEMVLKEASSFDIIHFHINYLHFPISRRESYTHLTTLHGRLDLPQTFALFNEFYDMPVVSISNNQRKPFMQANWIDTVYHGIPPCLFKLQENPGNYLAFLGRISPEKRVDRAIEIAKKSGLPIKIAAKVDKADREYYDNLIKPMLNHTLVDFIGEIGEVEKSDFLGNALAIIFPVDWPEPFGIVMIEAMACGTPVIAYPKGSVPEIIEHGVNGYLVNSIDEGVSAISNLSNLSRNRIREVFESRFTATRMCNDYIQVYCKLIEKSHIREVA